VCACSYKASVLKMQGGVRGFSYSWELKSNARESRGVWDDIRCCCRPKLISSCNMDNLLVQKHSVLSAWPRATGQKYLQCLCCFQTFQLGFLLSTLQLNQWEAWTQSFGKHLQVTKPIKAPLNLTVFIPLGGMVFCHINSFFSTIYHHPCHCSQAMVIC